MILVFNANKIKIVEFTQESVFVLRKPCALMLDFQKCIPSDR